MRRRELFGGVSGSVILLPVASLAQHLDRVSHVGVFVAARLEALAEPGGICVSRAVRDQVRDKLAFSFEDMGEQ